MTLPRRRCTAFLEDGRTRCGKHGPCTRVRYIAREWIVATIPVLGLTAEVPWPTSEPVVRWTRWVCFSCRRRMRLPDEDVDFEPGVVEISDRIDYTGTPLERQEFRLP